MSPPTRKTVAACVVMCLTALMLCGFIWPLFPVLYDSYAHPIVMGVVLAGAVVPTVRAWRRTTVDEREAEGRCVRCGYDLTGNVSGVCPEYETPIGRKP